MDALREHPNRNEICEHACHIDCGMRPPRAGIPGGTASVVQTRPQGGDHINTIDSFCPQFSDLIKGNNIGYLGRDCYMNNAYIPEEDDADLGHHSRIDDHQRTAGVVAAVVKHARPAIRASIAKVVEGLQPATELEGPGRTVVTKSFFKHAVGEGITLVELCAGIGSGLEAVLLNGIKVNRYIYVDIDPVAREIARHRVANLTARFPDLFPPAAWEHAFSALPQDINHVTTPQLDHLFSQQQQVLVMAGWPCQDYSPAGYGRPGNRAAILDKVIAIINRIRALQPARPVAYLLENVALQHNFRHENVRREVFADVVRRVGQPVTVDAANVGSYANRTRNYWTNLASPIAMRQVYDVLSCPHDGNLYDILQGGRHPMPVEQPSRSGHNTVGDVRKVLPTLMAYRQSRAFRPGRAGSLYDSNTGQFVEPSAIERELAMGYEAGTTAAPGISDGQRCQALGQAIDLNALFSIFQVARQLQESQLHAAGTTDATRRSHSTRGVAAFCCTEPTNTAVGDCCDDAHLDDEGTIAFVGQYPTDIWEDEEVVAFLQHSTLPDAVADAKRITRRAQAYRWQNNRLYKVVHNKHGDNLTLRLVPKPTDRDQIVLNTHLDLGHLGEKRCIAAVARTYWWYGMTVDVKRVIASCKECQRVKVSGGHGQRDMQTVSPDEFGIFHRWGLDYIQDLPRSAGGHKHALLAIDYYSKWLEVIPVADLEAETTKNAFVLNIMARYGTPAEIICDNGPAFKGAFRDFCARKGIHQRFITEDVPRSNGLAERAVQTVKNALRKYAAKKHHALDWDTEGLAAILTGYRCTPQAATTHSPARLVFALDPVLDAETHFARRGPIDYETCDIDTLTEQLLQRVQLARELGMSTVLNLRTAHEHDCRRFQARRMGLYVPKIYHFLPGDYVFILQQGQKPGGTLGIRARNEVLRVVEVRPSGVLKLVNQAGVEFEKHFEHCVPCFLPNLLGDTYAWLAKPPEDLPCQVCKDHRHWDVMLLCDNCNHGFHTFCLTPPLQDVPDGHWLCPDCVQAGMTMEQLEEKLARFTADEHSRPALEMPSRSRIAKAQKLANEWHGAAVKSTTRGRIRYGRVAFQGILQPKWFKITWADGSESSHMANIFPHLEKVADEDAPGIPQPPQPVVIATVKGQHPAKMKVANPFSINPWRCWTAAALSAQDPRSTVLGSMLRLDVIRQALVIGLSASSEDGSLGRSLQALLYSCSVRCPGESHLLDILRPGLQYLLETRQPDLLILPSDIRILHVAIPIALAYVKGVITFQLRPGWEEELRMHGSGWYYALHYSGKMVIQTIRSATYDCPDLHMYLFTTDRRDFDPTGDPLCIHLHRDLALGQWQAFD